MVDIVRTPFVLILCNQSPQVLPKSRRHPRRHMSGTHKIKIAARLRPRLDHEIDDQGIQITHDEDGEGPSWIRVPNPRDVTQVFRFPCVQFLSRRMLLDGMVQSLTIC